MTPEDTIRSVLMRGWGVDAGMTHDEYDAAMAALDALVAERDELAARLAEAERQRDEIKEKLDHLRSEWQYGRDRGDHLVYRDEWEAFDRWQRGREAAEARVAALTAAVVAECVDDLSVPCDCDEDAICLAHRVLAAADRPEGSDWNGERLQVLATAVGVARLHLANGDPGKAKNVLDVAAEKTHAIIRDSLIAQGHDADKVDALLGRPADRPEGTTPQEGNA